MPLSSTYTHLSDKVLLALKVFRKYLCISAVKWLELWPKSYQEYLYLASQPDKKICYSKIINFLEETITVDSKLY